MLKIIFMIIFVTIFKTIFKIIFSFGIGLRASGPSSFDDTISYHRLLLQNIFNSNFSLDIAEQLDSHQALVKQLAKAC